MFATCKLQCHCETPTQGGHLNKTYLGVEEAMNVFSRILVSLTYNTITQKEVWTTERVRSEERLTSALTRERGRVMRNTCRAEREEETRNLQRLRRRKGS